MESGDGLSFGEFSYPVLQAYDWWHMYNTFQLNGIQIQIGGADQYGNIMAGIEAINHIRNHHYHPNVRRDRAGDINKPMGFTVPLLTTSSGEKFGKSAGNAVWLDKDMTSPFELYQVWQQYVIQLVQRLMVPTVLSEIIRWGCQPLSEAFHIHATQGYRSNNG